MAMDIKYRPNGEIIIKTDIGAEMKESSVKAVLLLQIFIQLSRLTEITKKSTGIILPEIH